MADSSSGSNSTVARLAFCAIAWSLGLVFSGATTLLAQTPTANGEAKTMLLEPSAPLLPATLGKLRRASQGDAGDGLAPVDAADSAVMKENGLKRFAQSNYIDGPQHGTVAVYNFGDASGAVSAYDYLKKPGMHPEKLGDEAVANSDELLLHSGVNVVVGRFGANRDAVIALARELIDHLPKGSGSTALPPTLPTLAPAKGIDAESVRYALGPRGYTAMGGTLPVNLLGFDKSAEVVTAKSASGGLLTLLLYPTPQIAAEHQRLLQPALNGTEGLKMRREGTLLLVATGAWPAGEAERTINAIHLHDEVTWNKPVPLDFHAEVRKTFTLLESIALFCGISAVAMLVLGLFFGYGRALIRVMQGKPAASEPEFLRIDLRGALGKKLGERDD